MLQDARLSWHNCMFSPHWGSKPKCKGYTCSRTKVTVSCKTLTHPLSQQVEDEQLVRQRTSGIEMRSSGTEGAECCPEQLVYVPRQDSLCAQSAGSVPRLEHSAQHSVNFHNKPILTLLCIPCPLQLCLHSSLYPSFSLSLHPASPRAPLFLSLALAIDFPFPSSGHLLFSLLKFFFSFALKPTYIQTSIWSDFELTFFFPK